MHAKTIGLIAHTAKSGVAELINAIAQEFGRVSISVLFEKETARIAGKKSGHSLAELGAAADLLVVAGGDGTILHVVGQLGEITKPIFGINVGSLGLLTNRSIIVAQQSISEIEASDPDYPVCLTVDGRKPIHVERGSIVTIRKARKTLPLASLPDASFFSVVRQKLKWSGSNV